MSATPQEKEQHGKRLQQKEAIIKKRVKQAKSHNFPVENEHKFSKTGPFTCGDSNCAMCGNPRKFFKERTIQEKKFMQTEGWDG